MHFGRVWINIYMFWENGATPLPCRVADEAKIEAAVVEELTAHQQLIRVHVQPPTRGTMGRFMAFPCRSHSKTSIFT